MSTLPLKFGLIVRMWPVSIHKHTFILPLISHGGWGDRGTERVRIHSIDADNIESVGPISGVSESRVFEYRVEYSQLWRDISREVFVGATESMGARLGPVSFRQVPLAVRFLVFAEVPHQGGYVVLIHKTLVPPAHRYRGGGGGDHNSGRSVTAKANVEIGSVP